MLILPAIDLLDGRPVRLTRGDFAAATDYARDAVATAAELEALGAAWLHVVDLDAARGGGDNRALIGAIRAAVGLRLQVGGGVRTPADARRLVEMGVDRVVVGSALARDPDLPARWAGQVGDRLVAGIDADRGVVKTHGWQQGGGLADTELAARMSTQPVRGIVYTSIARDGTLAGPDHRAHPRRGRRGRAAGDPVWRDRLRGARGGGGRARRSRRDRGDHRQGVVRRTRRSGSPPGAVPAGSGAGAMVNEYPAAGKPAVVLDAGGRVCAVARMDAKAFRKSLESGELWVLRAGRVLPLEATRGMTARVSETDGWYEARLETVLSPAGDGRAEPPPAPPERRPTTAGPLHDLEQLIGERRRHPAGGFLHQLPVS